MQSGEIFQQRYRIQSEVGRGSFGIVYAASDLQTGRTVAVKVLLPWTRGNPSLRHRLKREAKLTRLLKSPHAIRVHEIDETDSGEMYIAMELLEGQELTQLLVTEGRLRPDRAREIGRQVLDALAESHALGVIHRDLKPHNIFICRGPNGTDLVKVLDFGIAKVAGTEDGSGLAETTRLTAPGGVLGTPAYMSPEQCRGEPLTPAADFYSLGIVLYEMVMGQVPFDDPNAVQVLVMHNTHPVAPLPSPIGQSPLGLAIMRALEKDPKARFRTAAEFLMALGYESLPPQAAAPARAAPAPQSHPVPLSAALLAPAPVSATIQSPPNRRRNSPGLFGTVRRYWIAALIVILLGLLVACYYMQ